MLGELLPCGGGRPIPLLKPKLVVGRQRQCDISLPFPTVSSRHSEMEYRQGCWHVRDLGSKNGTFVNGEACTAHTLLPDDVVAFAMICFKIAYQAAGRVRDAAPLPAPERGREKTDEAQEKQAGKAPDSVVPYGHLVPCGGGNPIALRTERIVIGRSSDCDVVLRFSTVSGRHGQLEWQQEASCWLVRDLASLNGTRVGGVPCETKLLPPGTILGIAGFRYQVVYGSLKTAAVARGPIFAQSLLQAAGLE